MGDPHTSGGKHKGAPNASGKPFRNDPRGRPATGRIAKLLIGQGHGFIRVGHDRDIFFHRGDLREGTSFNDLHVRDPVAFELLEDRISGPRAVRVERKPK